MYIEGEEGFWVLIIVEGEVNLKIHRCDYCGRAECFIQPKEKKRKEHNVFLNESE